MKDRLRIMILSLAVSVMVYLWLEKNMPLLSPQELYGISAGIGFFIGVTLNYLWLSLSRKRGAR